MLPFLEWLKNYTDRPWLVFGQGPTFSDHSKYKNLDSDFYTLGLNRTPRERRMFVAHFVDLHVLNDVSEMESRAEWLLAPWYPHVEHRPTRKSLLDFCKTVPALEWFKERGRLLWYNLSTSSARVPGSPVIKVKYFATEAVMQMLAMSGVKKIRTLGIDGGSSYAKEFSTHSLLRAGHNTYSLQDKPILEAMHNFGTDYGKLE